MSCAFSIPNEYLGAHRSRHWYTRSETLVWLSARSCSCGQAGPGEVLVKIRGGSEAFIAWSPEPLQKGTSVLVIDERGSRTVDVSAWDDPLDPAKLRG